MLSAETNIYEYEQLLMGQRTRFEVSFKGTPEENRAEVGNVWRYAVEHLLRWSPEVALRNLDSDTVKALYLDKTLEVDGIGYDLKKSYIKDYRFILQYAFPESIKYDLRAETIAEYEHVAGLGKWKNDYNEYKYAKRFFSGNNGILRAGILMRHVCNLYLGDMSKKDKYIFFANYSSACKWLDEKCLKTPLTSIYSSPLEYFHDSLPLSEKSEILYNACRLKYPGKNDKRIR